jgi:tetratricopeptide (TPR) repeat protein
MKKQVPYYVLLIAAWLSGSMHCFAQKNTIKERDSLMRLLPAAKHDTISISLLRNIGITWNAHNPNMAQKYYDKALLIAQKNNYQDKIPGILINKGYLYSQTGQSAKAIQILQEAIRSSVPEKDEGKSMRNINRAYGFIGLAFMAQGDLDNAYQNMKHGYDYFMNQRKLFPNEKHGGFNTILEAATGFPMSMGEIFLKKGQLDSALYYEKIAYQLLNQSKERNRYFTFHVPYLLGNIYLKKNQVTVAKSFIDEALNNSYIYSDSVGMASAWSVMASYYQQTNKPDSLLKYGIKAAQTGMNVKCFEAVRDASLLLKKYYESANNSQKALFYSDLSRAIQDSLQNIEAIRQSQRLLYEELQNQQKITQLQADNQNRMVKYGLGAGLLIVVLVASIFWQRSRRKQQENEVLDNKLKLQESEFAQKLIETEMTALRAQMNPHFIFNCLNSIKLYTLENDGLTATDYLTKFSRLIRLVLENSRSERITLANELETLELYIEMEAMRFKDKVKYSINVADDIDTHYVEVPPLLLQPYVENAIWHGLMHKEGGGMIWIDVTTLQVETLQVGTLQVETLHVKTLHATSLQITITDNGIGRAAAAALKSKSATHQKSFGLKMTSERIDLINQLYKTNTQVRIEDLEAGTRVIVEIPI